jgi:hypothetical protein
MWGTNGPQYIDMSIMVADRVMRVKALEDWPN